MDKIDREEALACREIDNILEQYGIPAFVGGSTNVTLSSMVASDAKVVNITIPTTDIEAYSFLDEEIIEYIEGVAEEVENTVADEGGYKLDLVYSMTDETGNVSTYIIN